MKLSTLLIAILASTTNAWEIAFHNTMLCEPQAYRIYEGPSSLTRCFTLGESQPGTSCADYTRGGGKKDRCNHDCLPFTGNSAFVRYGTCRIYNAKNCDESLGGAMATIGDLECSDLIDWPLDQAIGFIQSYRCWE